MKIGIIGRSKPLYEFMAMTDDHIAFIITSKEAPDYTVTATDFERFAHEKNIPFLYSKNLNNKEESDFLNEFSHDVSLCVSINYNYLIPKRVIDLFPLGILNAHGGDLPRYRGNACQAWAIINGEDEIGLCVHKMVPELDAGDIIERSYFPLTIDTKISEIYNWFDREIPKLFVNALSKLNQDKHYILEKQSENPAKSLRCYPRIPEDGRINWHDSSETILRLINASSEPYSGAFCMYNNEILTIWDANLVEDDEVYLAVPGQIAEINKKGGYIVVICGQGKIRLNRVHYKNKIVNVVDLFKSIRVRLI